MNYKIIALTIMTIIFIYEMIIRYFDTKSSKRKIPDNVCDIYSKEEYEKWLKYDAELNRFGFIHHIFLGIIDFCLIGFDAYAKIVSIFNTDNIYICALIVLAANSIIGEVIGIPFSYYGNMVIEEKYGFNRMTVKTFIVDKIKDFIIENVLMGALIMCLALMHRTIGNALIIGFSIIMLIITLTVNILQPIFIRIFNKLTPLEEGDLRTRLMELVTSNGCKVHDIYTIDGSKRSTKANAYFTGLGKLKTIVLYDTLMEQMTEDEILAVFAHEMGHNKHKDTLKLLGFSVFNIALISLSLWGLVSIPEIYADFGFTNINYGFVFIMLSSVVLSTLNPLLNLLQSALSRKFEYAADGFAKSQGYSKALISALKKLAKNNFSCLNPHPLIVFLTYTHPTISQRIDALEK